MALIGTIRKNSWILVVLIAFAMGGFILQSIVSGSNKYAAGSRNEIGKINGELIKADQFSETEGILYKNSDAESTYSNKSNLWNYFKNKALVQSIADKVGLGVSTEELLDLEFGDNPSPIISQRFRDQATGQINREQLNQVKQMIDQGTLTQDYPDYAKFWAVQEDEIINDRQQTKMINLIKKSIYTPKWFVEDQYNINKTTGNFNFVKVPFDKITDEEIEVKDSDIQSYIDKHKKAMTNLEESRVLKLVEIVVKPTMADMQALSAEVEQLKNDFIASENDSLFTLTHNGIYTNVFYKKDELPQQLKGDSVVLTKGTIVGPYSDGENFTIAKVIDIKVLPDSVKARHILRSVQNGDAESLTAAKKTIDSLKNVLESGAGSFSALAMQFSQDPGSASKGGDLGTFSQGRMVPEFNDVCFMGSQGKYYVVTTQFGVHLIDVQNQIFNSRSPKYKIAYVNMGIEPSQETQDSFYQVASQLVTESINIDSLEANAKKLNFLVNKSLPLKENDFSISNLGQGQTTREIVKWAFEDGNEKGDIAPTVYILNNKKYFFNEKYVIAAIDQINSKGVKTVEDAKADLEMMVKNQLKGKKIVEMIKNTDLNAVANQFQVGIDTAFQVTYDSKFVNNLGNEPKVMSLVFNGEVNKESTPIVGNGGTYIVKPLLIQKPVDQVNIETEQKAMNDRSRNDVSYRLVNELMKNVKIVDNRSKFF